MIILISRIFLYETNLPAADNDHDVHVQVDAASLPGSVLSEPQRERERPTFRTQAAIDAARMLRYANAIAKRDTTKRIGEKNTLAMHAHVSDRSVMN
jgi:hypothetical protein